MESKTLSLQSHLQPDRGSRGGVTPQGAFPAGDNYCSFPIPIHPHPFSASVGPTHTSFPWQLGLTRLLDSEKHPIMHSVHDASCNVTFRHIRTYRAYG